jgi:hypothetical protein
MNMKKFFYIVHLDRAKSSVPYGIIKDLLDETGVVQLNEKQRQLEDLALEAVGKERELIEVHSPRGDDAIFRFDDADTAHRFSARLHELACTNAMGKQPLTQCWFRVACAYGELSFNERVNKYLDGSVLIDVARLLPAKNPGRVLIDSKTYEDLSAEFQTFYKAEEQVQGKSHEYLFACHEWQAVPDETLAGFLGYYGESEDASYLTSDAIYKLFDKLKQKSTLGRIVNQLEIPSGRRPPDVLTSEEKQDKIVSWCIDEGLDKLERLYEILNELINKQNSSKTTPL